MNKNNNKLPSLLLPHLFSQVKLLVRSEFLVAQESWKVFAKLPNHTKTKMEFGISVLPII